MSGSSEENTGFFLNTVGSTLTDGSICLKRFAKNIYDKI